MYDITSIKRRFFPVKLVAADDTGQANSLTVEVGPPKLKTLRKLMAVSASAKKAEEPDDISDDNPMDDLHDAIRALLSKNKTGVKVPDEYIDAMDLDEMVGLLDAFFDWVNDARKNSLSPQPAK